MKTPKITQGEWKFSFNGHYHEIGVKDDINTFIYLFHNDKQMGISKEQAEANAKACSAVPDMIKALIEMATVWHSDVYHHFYHLYDQDAEKAKDRADNDEYYQMMINALKKAGAKL